MKTHVTACLVHPLPNPATGHPSTETDPLRARYQHQGQLSPSLLSGHPHRPAGDRSGQHPGWDGREGIWVTLSSRHQPLGTIFSLFSR